MSDLVGTLIEEANILCNLVNVKHVSVAKIKHETKQTLLDHALHCRFYWLFLLLRFSFPLFQNQCISMKGFLVKIYSGRENSFIRSELTKLHPGKFSLSFYSFSFFSF